MNNLSDILEDIDWRKTQLLIAKTLPFMHDFSDDHKEFLIRHSIPTIYATWEGFVQNSFQIYIRELNNLRLNNSEFCLNIFAHSFDASFPQLKEYPTEFDKKMKLLERLDLYLKDEFLISTKINTESNVGLEVINRICLRFNLQKIQNHPYKIQLQDLLKFRNRIAHGDISLVINANNVEDFKLRIESFVILVEDLMTQIYDRMFESFNVTYSYKKATP